MKEQGIKVLLSEEVIKHIEDKSIQNIIRRIIFNPGNTINWDEALKEVYEYMPEFKIKIEDEI